MKKYCRWERTHTLHKETLEVRRRRSSHPSNGIAATSDPPWCPRRRQPRRRTRPATRWPSWSPAQAGDRQASRNSFDRDHVETYTLARRLVGTSTTPVTWCRRPISAPSGPSPASGARPSSRPGSTASPPTAPPTHLGRRRARTGTRSWSTTWSWSSPARPRPAGQGRRRQPPRPPARGPRRLPPKLRAVVVLRDVYDLPHEAIAAELGISESRRRCVSPGPPQAPPTASSRGRARGPMPVRCDDLADLLAAWLAAGPAWPRLNRLGATPRPLPALSGRAGPVPQARPGPAEPPAGRAGRAVPGPPRRRLRRARGGGRRAPRPALPESAAAGWPSPAPAWPPPWPAPARRRDRPRHPLPEGPSPSCWLIDTPSPVDRQTGAG